MAVEAMNLAIATDAHAGKKISEDAVASESGSTNEQWNEASAKNRGTNIDGAANAAYLW